MNFDPVDNAEKKPTSGKYWAGFAAGAAIATGASVAALAVANTISNRNSRVVRLEDSVQVGRPAEEVFRSWSDLKFVANAVEFVNSVHEQGTVSYWDATIDGKNFKWKAEITQIIPNEAIGWKSVSGPKHTGRITFSSIGNDTLVHVTMNYVPPVGIFGRLLSPFSEHIEGHINQALRGFKNAMERGDSRTTKRPEKADWKDSIDRLKKTSSGFD